MSVCTRKSDGQIFAQWQDNGKTRRKYFGVGVEAKTAAEAYNATVVKVSPGRGGSGGPLFIELVNAYISHKQPNMTDGCFSNLTWRMQSIILPEFGQLPVSRLSPYLLDKYVAVRSKRVKRTTIHRELSDVRAIINWALKRKLIYENPIAGYEMPSRDDAVVLPPSQDEIERIISHSAPHLQRAMLLSYFLGLRPGAVELLTIKYNQVNWRAKTLTVISANKGGVDYREVPLHPSLPIREWFLADGKKTDRHIITWRGRPIKWTIRCAFNAAKKRAGVSDRKITMYSIRHAFITKLLHSGVDIHTIASITGHDVRTLLLHYAHAMDNVRIAAIGQLPTLNYSAPTGAESDE